MSEEAEQFKDELTPSSLYRRFIDVSLEKDAVLTERVANALVVDDRANSHEVTSAHNMPDPSSADFSTASTQQHDVVSPIPPFTAYKNPIDDEQGCCARLIVNFRTSICFYGSKHRAEYLRSFKTVLKTAAVVAYFFYFTCALSYRFGDEGSLRLTWITCVVVSFVVAKRLLKQCSGFVSRWTRWMMSRLVGKSELISWCVALCLFVSVILIVLVDAIRDGHSLNLVSGCGIIIFVFIFFIGSQSPSRVKWRTLVWGLALQCLFALLILRTGVGRESFRWMGDRVSSFLDHARPASVFVFGENYAQHNIAFKIMPVIIFFSFVISLLYHYGVIQALIRNIAWLMEVTMGTTPAESFNAAGNIFIGMSVALLLIRPLVHTMTRSELHAVMSGGFATISGGVLAALVHFGIPASHLMSASVMSAPAALAMAKVFYPETEVSVVTAKNVGAITKSSHKTVYEASYKGVMQSVRLIANILVNLIAFNAILSFINASLKWCGERAGINGLSFEFVCSYILWPIAYVMGVDVADCHQVAELLGLKMFLNMMVAYVKLADFISNRRVLESHIADNGTYSYVGRDVFLVEANVTLIHGVIQERSEMIATYAMCGFASFTGIAVVIGVLASIAPKRINDVTSVAIRAMIAGNIASFMTACVAGLLYKGPST